MEIFMDRRSGRTTNQIKEAPEWAIYVWPVQLSISHPKQIAKKLGRTDIKIVSLSWLKVSNVRGQSSKVILDHATPSFMTNREWDEWGEIKRWCS